MPITFESLVGMDKHGDRSLEGAFSPRDTSTQICEPLERAAERSLGSGSTPQRSVSRGIRLRYQHGWDRPFQGRGSTAVRRRAKERR